ncbi:hypothetical protein SDC9_95694 [bioreactor metagenome]|uniref:Uncharacterized protein n=1 Tax=bioreactor metagenome TaxID=1076179 RepID=A0A645A7C7_9ZZZZ
MPSGELNAQRLRRVHRLAKAVKVDIVVARAVHLDELELHLLRPHVVDVHKLRGLLRVAALEAVRQRVCGVNRGDAGN